MARTLVLGPFLDNVDEPAVPTPSPAAQVAIAFRTPATAPGGKVYLAVVEPPPVTPVYPSLVHAVYVPKGKETELVAAGDPQAFLDSPNQKGSLAIVSTPTPDNNTGLIDIKVDGVTPGIYFIQTVLEFVA